MILFNIKPNCAEIKLFPKGSLKTSVKGKVVPRMIK